MNRAERRRAAKLAPAVGDLAADTRALSADVTEAKELLVRARTGGISPAEMQHLRILMLDRVKPWLAIVDPALRVSLAEQIRRFEAPDWETEALVYSG